nr:sialomucin core protein 24-like [Nothobranchius furzeri]
METTLAPLVCCLLVLLFAVVQTENQKLTTTMEKPGLTSPLSNSTVLVTVLLNSTVDTKEYASTKPNNDTYTTPAIKNTSHLQSSPVATTPSSPVATAPSSPGATAPSSPVATAPSSPVATAPSSPVATAPSSPVATAPSSPEVTTPSSPEVTTPSSPVATAPSSPAATTLSPQTTPSIQTPTFPETTHTINPTPDTSLSSTENSPETVTSDSASRTTKGWSLDVSERNLTIIFSAMLGVFVFTLVGITLQKCRHRLQYVHQPLNNTSEADGFAVDDDTLVISGGLYDGHPIYDNVPPAPSEPSQFRLEFLH